MPRQKNSTMASNPVAVALTKDARHADEVKASPTIEKERLTVQLEPGIVNRMRAIVYWTPGLTMVDAVDAALIAYASKVEKDRGEAFKKPGKLKTGRPAKAPV